MSENIKRILLKSSFIFDSKNGNRYISAINLGVLLIAYYLFLSQSLKPIQLKECPERHESRGK